MQLKILLELSPHNLRVLTESVKRSIKAPRQSHLDAHVATLARGREGPRAPTHPFVLSYRAQSEEQGQGSLRPSFETPRYDRPD